MLMEGGGVFFLPEESASSIIAPFSRGAARLTFCYLGVLVHSVWVHLKTIHSPPSTADVALEASIKAARYRQAQLEIFSSEQSVKMWPLDLECLKNSQFSPSCLCVGYNPKTIVKGSSFLRGDEIVRQNSEALTPLAC